MTHFTPAARNLQGCRQAFSAFRGGFATDVNYPYFGNDLHDLESVVTIWKALAMYLKICIKWT